MIPIDTNILDNLIVGRIEPHIYAFTTNTVPNYLKVGLKPLAVWNKFESRLKKMLMEIISL